MGIQITVRDVNTEVFREFKAEAVKRGLTLGSALTIAMERFGAELGKKKHTFTTLKPISWGKGTKYTSEEVDTILYGD